MIDYVLIDGQPYCTAPGARAHASRAGWKGAGGGVLGLEATMAKLARAYRSAVLWRADDSVSTFSYGGGKVRQRTAEAGSDEARWLIGRFREAAGR